MSDWRPIESAPRDGTELVLWGGEGERVTIGRWVDGDWDTDEMLLKPEWKFWYPLPPKRNPRWSWELAFDDFWRAYPKKRGKGDAETAFRRGVKRETLQDVMEGLGRAVVCHDWLKEGGKFVPYPATWIRRRGWEDEYSEVHHVETRSFWDAIDPGGPVSGPDGRVVRPALDGGDPE